MVHACHRILYHSFQMSQSEVHIEIDNEEPGQISSPRERSSSADRKSPVRKSPSPVRQRSKSKESNHNKKRQRSKSPPVRRPEPKKVRQQRSPPRHLSRPNRFQYGSLVVLMIKPQLDDVDWRNVFQQTGYQIYDVRYPFRLAAKTVLRQNQHYKEKSAFSSVDSEDLALYLAQKTSEFMGENFISDYFRDWLANVKWTPKSKVVVLGLSDGRGSQIAIQSIRELGGIVMSHPPFSGDVHVSKPYDVKLWVDSLVSPVPYSRDRISY